MQDRRRHTRFATEQFVWCETDQWTVWVPTADLSAGGLFVRAPKPTASGEGVRLIHDGIGMVAHARVAWSRPSVEGAPGMGLEIRDFEQGEQAYLELLAKLSEGTG